MRKICFYWVFILFVMFSIHSCAPKKKNDSVKKATAFKDLGVAYMKDDMDAAAFKNLTKAESLNPNDPHIHFALGVFYFKKENYKQAIAEYKRSLELKPDFASIHNNLGLAYFELGDYDTAIEHFSRLVGNYVYATPHFPLFNIGRSYYHKVEYKKAIRYLKEALNVEPSYSPALLWLGRSYMKSGDTDRAVTTLLKGIRIAPKFAEMHYYLGRAYRMAKDYNNASRSFKKAIEMDPEGEIAAKAKQHLVQ